MGRRGRRERPGVAIPLTPLIDIVFLLLIYFFLTTNFFSNQGVIVDLPQSGFPGPRKAGEVTLTVERSGRISLEGQAMEPAVLLGILRARLDGVPDTTVVVRADREAAVQQAVLAMDLAKSAGAGRLFLETRRVESE